jgi:hypothetical protein
MTDPAFPKKTEEKLSEEYLHFNEFLKEDKIFINPTRKQLENIYEDLGMENVNVYNCFVRYAKFLRPDGVEVSAVWGSELTHDDMKHFMYDKYGMRMYNARSESKGFEEIDRRKTGNKLSKLSARGVQDILERISTPLTPEEKNVTSGKSSFFQ